MSYACAPNDAGLGCPCWNCPMCAEMYKRGHKPNWLDRLFGAEKRIKRFISDLTQMKGGKSK